MRKEWGKANFPVFVAGRYKRDWGSIPENRKTSDLRPGLYDHRDFNAANQGGDIDAALRVVRDCMDRAYIACIKMQLNILRQQGHQDPILVVPYKEGSKNMLAHAAAARLSKELGLEIDTNIIQTGTESRKSMSRLERLFKPATFSGASQAGRLYIVVDDVMSTGSTLADMRGHFKANGSEMAFAAVLGTPTGTHTHLNATAKQISAVECNLSSSIRGYIENAVGFGIKCLTQSEGLLLSQPSSRVELRNFVRPTAQIS